MVITLQKLLPESLESCRRPVSSRVPDGEARDVVQQEQVREVGCHRRLCVVHQQTHLSRLGRTVPGHLGQGQQ